MNRDDDRILNLLMDDYRMACAGETRRAPLPLRIAIQARVNVLHRRWAMEQAAAAGDFDKYRELGNAPLRSAE